MSSTSITNPFLLSIANVKFANSKEVNDYSTSKTHLPSLMSIVNNERGGSLKPVTERVGNKDNPFLAYAFNRISGIKKLYHTFTSNKTAFDLFHDKNTNNSMEISISSANDYADLFQKRVIQILDGLGN